LSALIIRAIGLQTVNPLKVLCFVFNYFSVGDLGFWCFNDSREVANVQFVSVLP